MSETFLTLTAMDGNKSAKDIESFLLTLREVKRRIENTTW